LRTGIGKALEGFMAAAIKSGLRREKGQGLVEYALILLLVAVVLVGALTAVGGALSGMYDKIALKIASH